MTCTQHERLSAHLDGELSATEAAAFADHLSACETCQHEAQTLRSLDALLGLDEPAPLGMQARLEAIPAAHPHAHPILRVGAAAVLLVGVALAARMFLRADAPQHSPRTTTPVVLQVAPTLHEQIEAALRGGTNDDLAWLAELGPRVLAHLPRLAAADDEALARAAVRQMGRLRRVESLPALRAALTRPSLQRTAIVALGRVGHARGAAALGALLDQEVLAPIATEALVAIGGPAAARQLLRHVQTTATPVLLTALAEVGGAQAAQFLTGRVASGDDGDRAAMKALRRGGPALIGDVIRQATGKPSAPASNALRVLEMFRPAEAVPALTLLLDDPERRMAAARVLARIDTPAAINALLGARRAYELHAAFDLAGAGGERVLIRRLSAGKYRDRAQAVALLARCGGDAAVEALAKATQERALASDAVAAIGRIGTTRAAEALGELAGDRHLRQSVIAALGTTGRPAAVGPLLGLGHTHRSVRTAVLDSLSQIPHASAVEAIVKLEGGRQARARRVLGAMDPALVRATLTAMLDSDHAREAQRVLSRFRTRDPGSP